MALLVDGPELTRLSPRHEADRERVTRLVRELRASNVQVHRAVLAELSPRVTRWVRGWLGPAVDPRDATQEALCQIASALHRYRGRSSLATFAHRITYRVVARARKRARSHEPLGDHPLVGDDDPGRRAEQRRAAARLYRHLDRMNERRRNALVMVELLEMTPKEAAELAGTSPSAMRNLLMHARRELRERLRRDPAFGDRT